MKKLIVAILMIIAFAGYTNAQNVVREGNTFTTVKVSKKADTKTKYTWKDSKGVEYPIYVGNSGACYVFRISKKTGKEYKYYLGAEISAQICKELGIKYEPKTRK